MRMRTVNGCVWVRVHCVLMLPLQTFRNTHAHTQISHIDPVRCRAGAKQKHALACAHTHRHKLTPQNRHGAASNSGARCERRHSARARASTIARMQEFHLISFKANENPFYCECAQFPPPSSNTHTHTRTRTTAQTRDFSHFTRRVRDSQRAQSVSVCVCVFRHK